MKRLLCSLAGLLLLSTPLSAQSGNAEEEMRFVSEMRSRGYNDLALEYLEKLQKNASPELAKQLPLEIAKTRVEAANEEPDSTKRASLYTQAKANFEKFVADNPKHPRLLEAKLDIANIAVLQARNQLSKAFLSEASQYDITPELLQARSMFQEAAKEIKKVSDELDIQIAKLGDPKLPADQLRKRTLEEQRRQAQLTEAINLFDIAQTFPRKSPKDSVLLERGDWVAKSAKVLENLSGQDGTSPTVWKAKAWFGRCLHENGELPKAREVYANILTQSRYRPAQDGYRLARYFRLLVIEEKPEPNEDKFALLADGTGRWVRDYPRQLKTREGYGVMFMRAKVLISIAQSEKATEKQKEAALDLSRKFLSLIERSENMYTDRARRFKIGILAKQGTFSKKIDELTSFEDCYVRSQYEGIQATNDDQSIQLIQQYFPLLAKAKDGKEQERLLKGLTENAGKLKASLEALDEAVGKDVLPDLTKLIEASEAALKIEEAEPRTAAIKELGKYSQALEKPFKDLAKTIRDARQDLAIKALERGLEMPDAKSVSLTYEVSNARMTLTFHHLSSEKYQEAIKSGEAFARTSPRSSQAPTAALYVLQAYVQLLSKYNEIDDKDKIEADTEKMKSFAQYVKSRWGNELAGNLARHQLAMVYMQQKKPIEALAELNTITTDYSGYAATQFMVAKIAIQAHQEGKKAPDGGSFRDLALAALERIEAPGGGDPAATQSYFLAKCQLAEELFKDKAYARMGKIAEPLMTKVGGAFFTDDQNKNKEMKDYFVNRIGMIQLFSIYGQANAAYQAKDYAKTTTILDPLVDLIIADKMPMIKQNPQLAQALMTMALQSDLRTDKLDRARFAIQALDKSIDNEGLGGGDIPLSLKMVIGAIRERMKELKAKGDEEALKKNIDGFRTILTDLQKEQKDPTPKFLLAISQCYANLTLYHKSAELLEKFPVPDFPKLQEANPEAELPKDLVGKEAQIRMLQSVEKDFTKLHEFVSQMGKAAQEKLLPDVEAIQKRISEALVGKNPATIQAVMDEVSHIPQELTDSFKMYQTIRLARARMFRLNQELDKASEAMEEIMGTKEKQGWGRKNLDALVEYLDLNMDLEEYSMAIALANGIVKALATYVDRDPALKEKYLDTYYKMVFGYTVLAQKRSGAADRKKAMETGATVLKQLTKKYPDFGGESWKVKFTELLTNEPELKAEYDALQ